MDLLLDRDVRTKTTTTGKLYVDGVFECFVLEDQDRELKQSMPLTTLTEKKVKGKTCIPEGRYEVKITFSNRFQKPLPILLNVPGFEGIRIHTGNTAANTEGCLLPGRARSAETVTASRLAFVPLFEKIKSAIDREEKVFITIQA